MGDPLIVAIDAGSPKNCGWAVHLGETGCGSLTQLIVAVAEALKSRRPVALGIEAPLWVPLHTEFSDMTRARGQFERDYRRAWSAGAGTGSLGAGLVNLGWTLRALHKEVGPLAVTTRPDVFRARTAQSLLWEAFVSGSLKTKGAGHPDDARQAADTFAALWPEIAEVGPELAAINLAFAACCATGHFMDATEAGRPVPVIIRRT